MDEGSPMQDEAMRIFGKLPPGKDHRDRNAAYAVIKRTDGRVAAVYDNVVGCDNFWLPGGGIERGETLEETIHRELREELDRRVRATGKLAEAVQYFFAGDENVWYKMTAHFFTAEFLDDSRGRGQYETQWVDVKAQSSVFFHECHAWAAEYSI